MKIDFVDIQNFRKLKSCRIDFSDKQTLFVGANNSGKTSAMDALILFFKSKNRFETQDFTLSNWKSINEIGSNWITADISDIDLSIKYWESFLPTMDVWLNVNKSELHYIHHLIPTLDWDGGLLGVRLRFEPNNIEELYNEFTSSYNNSQSILSQIAKRKRKGKRDFNLWPKDMWDFLNRNLNKYFSVKYYLLDPSKSSTIQDLAESNIPLESDAFSGLIKIDIINAQRGFTGTNPEEKDLSHFRSLSSQLRSYYNNHLNPSDNPTKYDIDALSAIFDAKKIFDNNLKTSLKKPIEELELINYPGFGSPKITLSSRIDTAESLNHDSSVQYSLDEKSGLSLPEKYNGLGYQNLISIIFKLIKFRDEWMKVGTKSGLSLDEHFFEPLHLVLIEEPEAHLHAQVQQVFINQAYNILRNNEILKDSNYFSTQLLISTHSSHIVHEVDFTSLRYFKRLRSSKEHVDTSTVVNLSQTFGSDDQSVRFSKRYLKTTHCDLFFADAAILVEGPVEKILVPYFLKKFKNLSNSYISILEIGGSHAHRLKPLIENLGLTTLIITDIDSVVKEESVYKKVQPSINSKYLTGNDTLKNWHPSLSNLNILLRMKEKNKVHNSFPIRVAYQNKISINNVAVYPYTFEDAFVMENKEFFKKLSDSTGLIRKMHLAAMDNDISNSAKKMYDEITAKGVKKAEFALELLYTDDFDSINVPSYINNGLSWLDDKINLMNK